MPGFSYDLNYATLDLRRHPELYRVGHGEQGVLLVQPYKGELLPLWGFKDPQVGVSADAIREKFDVYLAVGDFVGADMARKFLQMGFTRARRYANHKGGKKYDLPIQAARARFRRNRNRGPGPVEDSIQPRIRR